MWPPPRLRPSACLWLILPTLPISTAGIEWRLSVALVQRGDRVWRRGYELSAFRGEPLVVASEDAMGFP